MQYRSFGKLDWEPSALGFGTMRLPILGSDQAEIDQPQAIALIRRAIDEGVNYIDSAYVYHDGYSEVVVGKALSGKYRGKAKIATKMPVFSVNSKSELDGILNLQLKRLGTDFIDFYLFHALTKDSWAKVKKLDMLRWAERQVDKGKIGYLGFSFHDELDVFKEIIDDYDGWVFCQIQYNYLDEWFQAGKNGLKYAADRGLAVVVMEPLAGGLLAVNPPVQIHKELRKAGANRSPADWALQWVWNHPEVSLALSGMNSLQQLDENLASACKSGPNTLTQQEVRVLQNARSLYLKLGHIGCTKCRYCGKCPKGIDIPVNLAFLSDFQAKRREPKAQDDVKAQFKNAVPPEKWANNCIYCGQCEALCPQHLPVRKLLCEAASSLQ